jgi:hypothetical protein
MVFWGIEILLRVNFPFRNLLLHVDNGSMFQAGWYNKLLKCNRKKLDSRRLEDRSWSARIRYLSHSSRLLNDIYTLPFLSHSIVCVALRVPSPSSSLKELSFLLVKTHITLTQNSRQYRMLLPTLHQRPKKIPPSKRQPLSWHVYASPAYKYAQRKEAPQNAILASCYSSRCVILAKQAGSPLQYAKRSWNHVATTLASSLIPATLTLLLLA